MPRPRVYRTQAIVLRERDYGEADRILTLLTPGGKVSALARGVRWVTSRKAPHLELFHRAEVMLAQGREMDIVTQAETLEPYEGLRHDLLRFTYGCYAAELVDHLVPENEESPDVYDLVASALGWFATEKDLRLWARFFEIRLLQLCGYQPEFFVCVSCGAPLEPAANRFDVTQGGLVCPTCAVNTPNAQAISLGAQKVLRYFVTHGPEDVARLNIRESTHRELEALLHAFLQYILEQELKSTAFLRRLRSELALREARTRD